MKMAANHQVSSSSTAEDDAMQIQLRQYLSEVEQNTFIKSNISNPMDFLLSPLD
jgi:hypothetical protein